MQKKTISFLFVCFFISFAIHAQDSLRYDKKILKELTKLQTPNAQTVVLLFLDTECPICQKYTLKINQIDSICKVNQIPLYGIFTAKNIKKEEISFFKSKYNLKLPTLIDKKLVLTKGLKASTTPEVFFISRGEEAILYRGLIDNWFYMLGRSRKEATEHYLLNAIGAYLKKEKINVKKTTPIGCLIEY